MTICVQYLEDPPRIEITQSDNAGQQEVGRIVIANVDQVDVLRNNLNNLRYKLKDYM